MVSSISPNLRTDSDFSPFDMFVDDHYHALFNHCVPQRRLCTLCLVNKKWAKLTGEYLIHIFRAIGAAAEIPNPFSNAACFALIEDMGFRARYCETPTVLRTPTFIDFSEIETIHIVHDTHLIAWDEALLICPIDAPDQTQIISVPSSIESICSVENRVYFICSMDFRVLSIDLNTSYFNAEIFINLHSEPHFINHPNIKLLVNDRWLIISMSSGRNSTNLQKWDRLTGKLVFSTSFSGHLYASELYGNHLYCGFELNDPLCGFEANDHFPVHRLDLQTDHATLLGRICPTMDDQRRGTIDFFSLEMRFYEKNIFVQALEYVDDENTQLPARGVLVFNKNSYQLECFADFKSLTFPVPSNTTPKLFFTNTTIIATSIGYGNVVDETDNTQTIDFFDWKKGQVTYSYSEPGIKEVFPVQDKLLYTNSKNEIVQLSFPLSQNTKKRPPSTDLEPAPKRRKIGSP